jgi:hypothetical protein
MWDFWQFTLFIVPIRALGVPNLLETRYQDQYQGHLFSIKEHSELRTSPLLKLDAEIKSADVAGARVRGRIAGVPPIPVAFTRSRGQERIGMAEKIIRRRCLQKSSENGTLGVET